MSDKHLASIEAHGGFLTITSLRCLQQLPSQSTPFDQNPGSSSHRRYPMPSLWFLIPAGLVVGSVLCAIVYAHVKGLNDD